VVGGVGQPADVPAGVLGVPGGVQGAEVSIPIEASIQVTDGLPSVPARGPTATGRDQILPPSAEEVK
jgi:hypothetical protein